MKPKTISILTLLIFCHRPSFSQEIDPSLFKSTVASRAVREFHSRGNKATKKFLEEKEDATEELISELQKVLKETTQEGDLEEALKIQNSIDVLKKDIQAVPSALASSNLVGRWKIRYSNAGVYYNDIIKNGDGFKIKRWIEPDKKLETVPELLMNNGEIWIVWNKGERRDRVQLLPDGRIFIEHWFVKPGRDMTEYPQQYAVGEKMNQ